MAALKAYLDSFKLNKHHGLIFFIDIVAFWLIMLLFIGFGSVVGGKAAQLTQGQDIEAIKQSLLTGPLEQLQEFQKNIQQLAVLLVGGGVLLISATVLIFSLGQALIWNKLKGTNLTRKTYWRWNGLHLTLVALAIAYVFLFLFIRSLIMKITFLFNNRTVDLLVPLGVNIIFVLLFLLFLFLVQWRFVQQYKVGESFLQAVQYCRTHGRALVKLFLYALLTIVILSLLLYPVGSWLSSQPRAMQVINMVITFLYLAWLRMYLLQMVQESHS